MACPARESEVLETEKSKEEETRAQPTAPPVVSGGEWWTSPGTAASKVISQRWNVTINCNVTPEVVSCCVSRATLSTSSPPNRQGRVLCAAGPRPALSGECWPVRGMPSPSVKVGTILLSKCQLRSSLSGWPQPRLWSGGGFCKPAQTEETEGSPQIWYNLNYHFKTSFHFGTLLIV